MATSANRLTFRRTPARFEPYVPASQSPAEFTIKAIVLGALFGLLFGASTVYLGLRAGLTVSASIPIAVLAISVLKKLGGSTILENNIVQTIGSAGESLAGGVVFTIPALIFLTPNGPAYFNYLQITMLTFAGGILGVLMMVPLRRALIVKEHGVLPYPRRHGLRRGAGRRREGRQAGGARLRRPGRGRAVEVAVVDLRTLPHRDRLLRAAHQPVSERHAQRGRLARIPRRRLRDRPAHRRHDVRRRRAVVAGAAAAALDARPVPHRAAGAHPPELRQQPGHRPPVPAERDGAGSAVERLHPLHRRRRRAGLGAADPGPHHSDHRRVGAWQLQGPVGAAGGANGGQLRTERDIPMAIVLGGSLALGIFLAVHAGPADAGQRAGRGADPGLRLLLRHGVVAHQPA